MSTVYDIIIDSVGGQIAIESEQNIEDLRQKAYERCHDDAENLNIYYSDALENLDRYRQYEPSPEELRESIEPNEVADWRNVMVQAAIYATVSALEVEVEADITRIEEAIAEARKLGLTPTTAMTTCDLGSYPHISESEVSRYGTLYNWAKDRELLRVRLTGGAVWIHLTR